MTDVKSYRQILRSSFIVGGASVFNILLSIVRMKAAAVLVGPMGVGLIGIFQSLVATVSAVASLGLGNVGTRQIAEAVGREDAQTAAAARRALYWGTLVLAVIGAAAFWGLRGVMAEHVLDDASMQSTLGWLAVGVSLTVVAGSQAALLTGFRRIGDIARVSVLSSMLSAAFGVGVLVLWGDDGVWIFVLAGPVCSVLVGYWFVSRLPKQGMIAAPFVALVQQWKILAKLGVAFMLAGLIATMTQLLVRALVQRQLGAEGLGYFQASWQISMTYLGFILAAMGTDYYPRLTASIQNHPATNRLVNEQTEVALLLGGPVLLAMLALTPWIIDLLYSPRFGPAVNALRWQILGDLLKVVSWPLGFVLLAAGKGRVFLIAESVAFGMLAAVTALCLPWYGVEATGVAFFGMYGVYLPTVYWLVRRMTGFSWTPRVQRQLCVLIVVCAAVKISTMWSPLIGAGAGVIASAGLSGHALMRLSGLGLIRGALPRFLARKRVVRNADEAES